MTTTSRRLRALIILAALALVLACRPSSRSVAPKTIAYVHVNLVPMDTERILPDHTLVAENGVIVALGPSNEVEAPPESIVIDGSGNFLLPGLFDMHVHINEEERDEHLVLYLANGVTTVQSMDGRPRHLDLRRHVEAGERLGPTIFTAVPTAAHSRVDSPETAERLVREQKAAGYDAIKMYGDGSESMARETYARVISAAHEQGLRVVGHAPRNHPLDVVLEEGQDSIDNLEEVLYTYPPIVDVIGPLLDLQFGRAALEDVEQEVTELADLRPLLEPAVERLAAKVRESGLAVTPTLVAFETLWRQTTAEYAALLEDRQTRFMSPITRAYWGPEFNRHRRDWSDRLEAVEKILRRSLELQMTIVRSFRDAGVPIMVGTAASSPFVYPGFAVHRELALLTESGLTPYEALRAATVTPAEELGISDEVGTLAMGKRADLILVEGNPLDDVTNASRLLGVIVRGKGYRKQDLDGRVADLAAAYRTPAEQIEKLMVPFRERRAEEIARLYNPMNRQDKTLAGFVRRLIDELGYSHLREDEDVGRAIEAFRLNTEIFPADASTWDSLGEAQMSAGDWQGALASYRQSVKLDPGDTIGKRRIEWIELAIQAEASPVTLSDQELERFAGDYGSRHVEFRDGALYYRRGDGPERQLTPMTEDTFALEGLPTSRLRFVAGPEGRTASIVDLYDDGRTEEALRD